MSEAVFVKEEPEWDACASDMDMELKPVKLDVNAELKPVKLDVEPILPCVTSTYTKAEIPEDGSVGEADVIKSEVVVEFKDERGWCDDESAPRECNNEMNDAVYGPELLKLLTNPIDVKPQVETKRQIRPVRSCSVRIERMPAEKKKKPYICKICYKIFDLKTGLLTHLDMHSAEELHPPITVRKRVNKIKTNVECDICGQKCASKSHLVIHYRKHTGERPFACKLCDKSYAQRANLLKHELCHTGEKPYSCQICMKRFSIKISLAKHVCVPYKKTYPCEICKLQCNSKMDLIKHIEVHTEHITCDVCSIKFKDNSDLEHHMLIHTCVAQMRRNFPMKDFLKAQAEKHFPPRRKARGGKNAKKAW